MPVIRASGCGSVSVFQISSPVLADHLCGHGEEVRAILPVDAIDARQTEVGFMYQGGRLQTVPRTFGGHTGAGYLVQLAVHERNELAERGGITIRP